MGFWQQFDRINAKTVVKLGSVMRVMVKLLPAYAKPGEETPFSPLKKNLSECTLGLITSCGVHPISQQPFDMENRLGDPTYREFAWDDVKKGYTVSHSHIDSASIMKDINVAIPGDRIKELASQGVIKGLYPTIFSFMGFIPKTGPLVKKYAPESADKLKAGGVDIVLLTPC